MLTLGVDIGSTTSKAALLEDGTRLIGRMLIPAGTGTRGPREIYQAILHEAGVQPEQVSRTVATGYGRMGFRPADREVSEVTCHSKGVHFLVPTVRTVVDIGGQDAKGMIVAPDGRPLDFVMNDKCAAGTGRFLEAMSRVLDVPVGEMGPLSLQAAKPTAISSTCTVFAESEVISRLSQDEAIPDILAGIHLSVARRVAGLVLRLDVAPDVVMSGGVARNRGVVAALEQELGQKILVPDDCQLAGAIGAAVIAWEDLN